MVISTETATATATETATMVLQGIEPEDRKSEPVQVATPQVSPENVKTLAERQKRDQAVLVTPKSSIFLLYDERMRRHHPLTWNEKQEQIAVAYSRASLASTPDQPSNYVFENPLRLQSVYSGLLGLESRLTAASVFPERRFRPLLCTPVTRKQVLLAHTEKHYDKVVMSSLATMDELAEMSKLDQDIYFNSSTFLAASLACGGVLRCVDSVLDKNDSGSLSRAIAVVRPPGHHACQESAMGFCFFNSVAVAAKYAIDSGRANRVLIVDWDIHHGNGTQDVTFNDSSILYISLHRYDPKRAFFPSTGAPNEVSDGTNLNVAWTKGGMGNPEYAAAFSELILPLVVDWMPDLVLVSSGFDAAEHDLIGDCNLSPDMYHALTKSLVEAAGVDVPVVVALEGGYNLEVIGKCMQAVALALLDEGVDQLEAKATVGESCTLCMPAEGNDHNSGVTDNSSSHRLAMARQTLSVHWRCAISMNVVCADIDPCAIKSINRSIGLIERSKRWTEKSLKLRRLVYEKCASRPTGGRLLRERTRASPRKLEELHGLDETFTKLSLK